MERAEGSRARRLEDAAVEPRSAAGRSERARAVGPESAARQDGACRPLPVDAPGEDRRGEEGGRAPARADAAAGLLPVAGRREPKDGETPVRVRLAEKRREVLTARAVAPAEADVPALQVGARLGEGRQALRPAGARAELRPAAGRSEQRNGSLSA